MRLVEFKLAKGGKISINPIDVVYVKEEQFRGEHVHCLLNLRGTGEYAIAGTFDEVMKALSPPERKTSEKDIIR